VPVVLTRYPIVYHATPKVACTSIKLALYELEYQRCFQPYQDDNGRWKHIHNSWQGGTPFFSSVPNPQSYFKFAVVRDPLERFLSAFANRVVHHHELSEKQLASLKGEWARLKPNPSLSEFIADLDSYRAVSWQIRHHTDPQINFIGEELAYYDEVFAFADLHKIPEVLKAVIGVQIILPHEQGGGPKFSSADLNGQERQRIFEFYATDYRLLRNFYQSA
jgi:hypothetical protein